MPGNMIASRTGCALCNNLGQKKIEQQTPIPPKNQGWSRAKAKTRPFFFFWLGGEGGGGGGGINFPSVLSKIVVVLMMYSKKLRFRPSTPRKQKAGDFKTLRLLTISDFKNTLIRVSGRGLRVICHPSDMLA